MVHRYYSITKPDAILANCRCKREILLDEMRMLITGKSCLIFIQREAIPKENDRIKLFFMNVIYIINKFSTKRVFFEHTIPSKIHRFRFVLQRKM